MPKRKALRAAIYARTSRDDEEDKKDGAKTSIVDQIKACKKIAERDGYEVVGRFKDPNRSGRTYPTGNPLADADADYLDYCRRHIKRKTRRTRDGLARLLRMLPEIDVVVVRDVTRWMRPLANSYLAPFLWQELSRHNAFLHTQDGKIEPANFSHQLVNAITSRVTDRDVAQRVEQSKTALATRRDSGKLYHCPKCFGYRSAGHQKVKPVERELKIVRRIFALFLDEAAPLTLIARTLNDAGVATMLKGGMWSVRQIKAIVGRPEYAGYQTDTDGHLIKSQPFAPHAVISLNRLRQARGKLVKLKGVPKVRQGKVHPLSGLLFCGYCCRKLYVRQASEWGTAKKCHYYVCLYGSIYSTKSGETLGCRMTRIRERTRASNREGYPDNVGLLDALAPLAVTGILNRLRLKDATSDIRQRRAAFDAKLADLDEKDEELSQAYRGKDMHPRTFRKIAADINSERRQLTAEIERVDNMIAKASRPVGKKWWKLNSLKPTEFRDVLRDVVDRVNIYAFHVEVVLVEGGSFVLERVPLRNSRAMPMPESMVDDMEIGDRVAVGYHYKSSIVDGLTEPMVTVFESDTLVVMTSGSNPQPYQYARDRKRRVTPDLPDYVLQAPFKK